MTPTWTARALVRLYRCGVGLYPVALRERFGRDMEELFLDLLQKSEGPSAIRTALRAFAFLLADVVRVRWDHWRAERPSRFASHNRPHQSPLMSLASDVRYALRALRKNPVFSTVAILVIAMGSGAVTTIYSVANAVVLRPIPAAAEHDRLVEISRTQENSDGTLSASYPYVQRLRARSRSFERIAAWSMLRVGLGVHNTLDTRLANLVSDDYFSALGVRPHLGRLFTQEESGPTSAIPVVVLSHSYWQTVLAGDSAIVGATIRVNGRPFTVVGIAPPRFRGVFTPLRTDAWIPLTMRQSLEGGSPLEAVGSATLSSFGLLKRGVSREAAQRELADLTRAYADESGEPTPFRRYRSATVARLSGLPGEATSVVTLFFVLLFVAASMVLLIACVNVAAMLLSRNIARRRELAVRVALGAARSRLVSLLLAENMTLFVLGAIGGVGVAVGATSLLERAPLPVDLPLALELSPDFRVLIFALGAAFGVGILFGLVPALHSARLDVSARLRDGTAGAGTRRSRVRNSLVAGQMALSLLLLVGAGLFLRALSRGQRVDPGFTVDNVTTASFDAQSLGYDEARGRQFFRALAERTAQLPNVAHASYAKLLPLSGSNQGEGVFVDGYTGPGADETFGVGVDLATVDAGFFSALEIPLIRGREFSAQDVAGAAKAAVISQSFADKFWPAGDPIGRVFRVGSDTVTVIGVVRDVRFKSLRDAESATLFLPLEQHYSSDRNLVVRAKGSVRDVEAGIAGVVQSLDPSLPRPMFTTLRAATAIALLPQRVAALVTGVLGTIGLVLATVGLYGVVAYSTSQRVREMGVRMALGATRADVVRLVLREGMKLVAIGSSIGLALALVATRALSQFLFGVSALDWVAFVGGGILLGLSMITASYVPARRAAGANPMQALRVD